MVIAKQGFLERDGAEVLRRSGWLARSKQQPPEGRLLGREPPVLVGESQGCEAASTALGHGIGTRAGQLTLPPQGESSLERLQLSARYHTVSE